jgi:hypothetical protein
LDIYKFDEETLQVQFYRVGGYAQVLKHVLITEEIPGSLQIRQ